MFAKHFCDLIFCFMRPSKGQSLNANHHRSQLYIRSTKYLSLTLKHLPSPGLEGKHCHHPGDQSADSLGQLPVGSLGGLLGGLPGDLPGGLPVDLPGDLLGGLRGGLLGGPGVPQTADSPSP